MFHILRSKVLKVKKKLGQLHKENYIRKTFMEKIYRKCAPETTSSLKNSSKLKKQKILRSYFRFQTQSLFIDIMKNKRSPELIASLIS